MSNKNKLKKEIKEIQMFLDNLSSQNSNLYVRLKKTLNDLEHMYEENLQNQKKFKKYKKIKKKLKKENKNVLKKLRKIRKKLVKEISFESNSNLLKSFENKFNLFIKVIKGEEI